MLLEKHERNKGVTDMEEQKQENGLRGIYALIKQFTNSQNSKIVLAYVAIISILEILAYVVGGFFTIAESRIWMACGVICFTSICCWFVKDMICNVKKKDYLSIIGVFFLIGLFGYFVGNINYSDINPDATQQMAAGISSFEQSDWNFAGSAFLGYPNRQYLIAALPAFIFGRSIFTLHLGFALPFFIGLIMMYLGLKEWCQKYEVSNKVALIAVYAILPFRFVAEYFMNFEQAVTPISLTMLALGLFLKFTNKPTAFCLNLIVWVGTFAVGSYTPVWAALGLLIVLMVIYAWEIYSKREEKYNNIKYPMEIVKSIGYAIIGMGIVTIIVITHTTPQKMEQTREEISILKYFFECIRDYFFDKDAVFFGGMGIIVLIYMIFSLTCQLKMHDFVISVWVLAVVVLANYMTGYTTYQKAWILQRTLIIIPVLIVAITMAVLPKLKNIQKQRWLMIPIIVFGVCGIYNFNQAHQSFTYFSFIQPMKYMLYTTEDILEEEGLDVEDEFNLVLYTDNQLQTNLECYTRFLYPNAHPYTGACSEVVGDMDTSLPTIIFSNETSLEDKHSGTVSEYTYYEHRYNAEITWKVIVNNEN